jgi:hypothetical protein
VLHIVLKDLKAKHKRHNAQNKSQKLTTQLFTQFKTTDNQIQTINARENERKDSLDANSRTATFK